MCQAILPFSFSLFFVSFSFDNSSLFMNLDFVNCTCTLSVWATLKPLSAFVVVNLYHLFLGLGALLSLSIVLFGIFSKFV